MMSKLAERRAEDLLIRQTTGNKLASPVPHEIKIRALPFDLSIALQARYIFYSPSADLAAQPARGRFEAPHRSIFFEGFAKHPGTEKQIEWADKAGDGVAPPGPVIVHDGLDGARFVRKDDLADHGRRTLSPRGLFRTRDR
jgi:hypothetical protein